MTVNLTSIRFAVASTKQVPSIQLNSAYIAPVYNSSHFKVIIIS